MDTRELDRGFEVAKRMMSDFIKKMDQAIADGEWSRAGNLEHYIAGMNQVIIIYEQAKARMIKE